MKKFIAIMILCFSVMLLTACGGGSKSAEQQVVSANGGNGYRVITCDESGAPVAGVMVQLCSDQLCQMGETDADGVAAFEADEGYYTVHVYAVPEGYAEDETEYPVPETYGDVNITIKTAE